MKKQKCCALDSHGVQCKNTTRNTFHYFGDNELYGHEKPWPGWIAAALCADHSSNEKTIAEKKNLRRLDDKKHRQRTVHIHTP